MSGTEVSGTVQDGDRGGARPLPRLCTDDVLRARRLLTGRVVETPVLRHDDLDALAGTRLWLKAENLQRGGSFKIRGALLAVGRLARDGSRGVVAQSTGNHAIAVAMAARMNGLPALLVLPRDVSTAKVSRIRAAGAQVRLVGTTLAERVELVEKLHTEEGFDVVDPYQDPDVIAGQGSATAELLSQVAAAGGRLDAVVLPVGGGSAVAGACLATAGQKVAVVAAEPAAVPALTAALRAGQPVTVHAGQTLADGLRPDRIGDLPFQLAAGAVADVLTVEETAIAEAMRTALMQGRLLVEPAAATALAAALRYAHQHRPDDIGVVLTGGNVEMSLVASVLSPLVP